MTNETTTQTAKSGASDGAANQSVTDVKAIIERFKLPGFDVEAFVASRKADIDALSHVTAATLTGAQLIAEMQAQALKKVLTDVGDALKTLPRDAQNAGELLTKQQHLAGEVLSTTLDSMKEIAEKARTSQLEIVDIAAERVRGKLEEIRHLAKT